jgi:hypothetical protein
VSDPVADPERTPSVDSSLLLLRRNAAFGFVLVPISCVKRAIAALNVSIGDEDRDLRDLYVSIDDDRDNSFVF